MYKSTPNLTAFWAIIFAPVPYPLPQIKTAPKGRYGATNGRTLPAQQGLNFSLQAACVFASKGSRIRQEIFQNAACAVLVVVVCDVAQLEHRCEVWFGTVVNLRPMLANIDCNLADWARLGCGHLDYLKWRKIACAASRPSVPATTVVKRLSGSFVVSANRTMAMQSASVICFMAIKFELRDRRALRVGLRRTLLPEFGTLCCIGFQSACDGLRQRAGCSRRACPSSL